MSRRRTGLTVRLALGSVGRPIRQFRNRFSGGARVVERIGEGVAISVLATVVVFFVVPSSSPADSHGPTYTFEPTVYRGDLVASRQWSLLGARGSRLHERLRLTNAGSAPLTTDLDEVIPKEVAQSV